MEKNTVKCIVEVKRLTAPVAIMALAIGAEMAEPLETEKGKQSQKKK